MNITTRLLTIIFMLSTITTNAQLPFGEDIIQDPLKGISSSFFPAISAPVKSFTYLIDKDTISISRYNKAGNETMKLEEFRKTGPLYKSLYYYTGKLKIRTDFYISNVLKNITTYKYNSTGDMIEWEKDNVLYDKQTQKPLASVDVHWIIEYNNRKMKSAYQLDKLNEKKQFYNYSYDAKNRLTATDEMQWQDKYEYSDDGPIKKDRLFKSDNSVYSSVTYRYNEKHRLIETTDKRYITRYEYSSDKLSKIICLKNSDTTIYQEILLSYDNNLLSKAEISGNDITMNFTNAAFIFRSGDLTGARNSDGIYQLRMQFIYNKFKSITEIKYFVNDVYRYSKRFIYEYY